MSVQTVRTPLTSRAGLPSDRPFPPPAFGTARVGRQPGRRTTCCAALLTAILAFFPDVSPARAATLSTQVLAPSLSVGVGLAVAPVYDGASAYAGTPLPLVRAVMPTATLGTLTASYPEGLRWDLPVGGLFGVALLGNYDPGRKARIRTLSGHDHHLRGMGDLGGTAMTGAEFSVNVAPYRLFVRGMQALRDRHYGGEALGRTAWLDAGMASELPLTGTLSMSLETYASWSDRHDMMARFGVTPSQAEHSAFHAHQAGGGLRGGTMRWGLRWQDTPEISFSGGVQLTALTRKVVRDSPLTEKSVTGGLFLNALYSF
ncbi:MipA/OmpV family protein [Raoultella ornithinolytica]|uniref:MipA/OmpV family protein n=1 Tax=Raoultella ornithinolytica TaxID=54291 RepID=UPI0021AEE7A8|nr:MipA/OmpV family protein [Raoultella ornithinolytica]MCT4737223.1 MipA/OmpV family protein [Raoultella ornithinolytica]